MMLWQLWGQGVNSVVQDAAYAVHFMNRLCWTLQQHTFMHAQSIQKPLSVNPLRLQAVCTTSQEQNIHPI